MCVKYIIVRIYIYYLSITTHKAHSIRFRYMSIGKGGTAKICIHKKKYTHMYIYKILDIVKEKKLVFTVLSFERPNTSKRQNPTTTLKSSIPPMPHMSFSL